MTNQVDKKQLRSFGFIVGGMFALIGLWPAIIHGVQYRHWSLIVAAFLLLPALVFPSSLIYIHRAWMALGHLLGWINTRIILGVVFFLIVTPIGLLRRWMGKDPVGRSIRPDLNSYRIPRTNRPPTHLKKQY